jgi:ribosomal protein S18 acetylase RimI-like enzyme
MPEIEVRHATTNDIEILSGLETGYYSEFVWQMNLDLGVNQSQVEFVRVRLPRRVFVPYPKKKSAIFENMEEAEVFLLAEISQRPVGYIKAVTEKDPHTAKVTDLVISAPKRRQGIGSGLLVAAMNFLANREFNTLIIELQSKNDPAIKMAHKLGFKFCGFRDHYFPNQELALFYSRFIG